MKMKINYTLIAIAASCATGTFTIDRPQLPRPIASTRSAESLLLQAQELYNAQDNVRARELFERVENQTTDQISRAYAQLYLGEIYLNGFGVTKDFVRARNFFEQAAIQTAPYGVRIQAISHLGEFYLNGWGVPMNYAHALLFFEPTAEQNTDLIEQARAQVRLGWIYFYGGHGVTQDYLRAKHYFQRAANQNVHQSSKEKAQAKLDELQNLLAAQKRAAPTSEKEPAKRRRKK